MNTFKLMSAYWEISSANPGKLKPNHASLYFYIMNLANKLSWKPEFGFPTLFAMEETNIRSRHTLNKILLDLQEFGLIKIVEDSKNQYTSKIIAMIKTYTADDTANECHDKNIHGTIHSTIHGTIHGTSTIDKPINNKTIKTNKHIPAHDFENYDKVDLPLGVKKEERKKSSAQKKKEEIPTEVEFINYALENKPNVSKEAVILKYKAWKESNWHDGYGKPINRWKTKLLNTLLHMPEEKKAKSNGQEYNTSEAYIKWVDSQSDL